MDNKPLNSLGRAGLYLTVFITGASVMVVELLGTRMIAPFYGASLYVWSSLISVTMIALALGYFVGGVWADRARRTGLSLVIALAALLTLAIPWASRPVLLATDPLGLRAGAFFSALVLFLPCLSFLGMVGPFAIKRATSRLDGVGAGAGSIYAVSTLGSVVGTLVLGFFLFPVVGAREILVGTGLALSVLAVLVAFYENRRSPQIAVMPSALLALVGMLVLPKALGAGEAYTGGGAFKILSERESLYGWVRVVEQPSRDLRFLTSDASMIGAASLSTGKGRMSYQHIVGMIPSLRAGMSRALIVGLGAGHMAKILQERYGISADTLEIDPAVQDAAVAYFDFKPTGKAIVGDARYEIRHLQGPYDLIIHDCFTGGSEPAHLLTVEALQQLRGLLSEHGVLAVNFVAFLSGGRNPALASVAKTMGQAFPHYSVFASEPGDDFNDFIFLASRQPLDLNSPALSPEQTAWLQARALAVDPANGSVLSDNLNPLEHLQTAKAEHYRHVIIGWFGPELLVR